jgi:hypothetical protein
MDKENLVYAHNGILCHLQQHDGSGEHCAKRIKPGTERQIPHTLLEGGI